MSGAVQLTVTRALPGMAFGAPAVAGAVAAGVTTPDGAENALGPKALDAPTSNRTGVPFVRPVTRTLVSSAPTVWVLSTAPVAALSVRTVKPLTTLPSGASKVTRADWLAASTPRIVGAAGAALSENRILSIPVRTSVPSA